MSGIWGNFTSSVARLAAAQAPGRLPEHLEPHKALFDILHTLPERCDYTFNMTARGTLLRFLFNTIFCRAEWIPFLLQDDEPVPLPRDAEFWAWHDQFGVETFYALSETQRRLDERRIALGQEPSRPVKLGRTCGRTLKRFDRTYTCK